MRGSSAGQFRQATEQVERLRIGQCVDIFHGTTVNDVSHRELGDLAADRARNVGDLNDLFWHVVRARVRADARADSPTKLLAQRLALHEAHEQHDAHVVRAVVRHGLADDDALDDLGKLLDLPIDLRRPDPNSARVEGRVASAVDDHATARRELGPIPVTPDVWVPLEVRRAVFRTIRVVPEAHRHTRKGRRAHQLAWRADERTTRIIEYFDAHAKTARLQLAPVHRPDWIAEREAGDDVRSPADAAQTDVALYFSIDVIEAVLSERAAGGEDRGEPAQIVRVARSNACFLGECQPLRAGAEHRQSLTGREIPQDGPLAQHGRAIVQHHRRAHGQAGYEPVPHHPPTGREVRDSILATQVGMEHELLEMLEERTAGAVHHALGKSRRPG